MGEVRPRRAGYVARVAPRRRGVNTHRAGESSRPVDPDVRVRRPPWQSVSGRAAALGCDGLDVDQGAARDVEAPVREREGTPRHAGQLQRLDVDQLSRERSARGVAARTSTLRAKGCASRAEHTATER